MMRRTWLSSSYHGIQEAERKRLPMLVLSLISLSSLPEHLAYRMVPLIVKHVFLHLLILSRNSFIENPDM